MAAYGAEVEAAEAEVPIMYAVAAGAEAVVQPQ